MSEKTITINPEFLSTTQSKNRDNKSRKKREKKLKPQSLVKPNKLRKQLLSRIKNFQKENQETAKELEVKTDLQEFNTDFNESLQYLEKLAKNKKEKKMKKSKQNNNSNGEEVKVSTTIPDELSINPPITTQGTATLETDIRLPSTHQTLRMKIKDNPPYSNLKNGSRPTYRQWKKTSQPQTISIENNPIEHKETERNIKLKEIKANYKDNTTPVPEPTKKLQKKVRTIKYHLGKSPEQISVLIKNRKTRKLVQHEHALLKQKSILEVKNYLRSKNLIKAGSNAPNDVLRQMYEQAILAGEISNKNKDNLIHNFFNDKN